MHMKVVRIVLHLMHLMWSMVTMIDDWDILKGRQSLLGSSAGLISSIICMYLLQLKVAITALYVTTTGIYAAPVL